MALLGYADGSDLARLLEAGGATLLEQLSPGVDLGTIKLFVPGTDDSAVRAAKELKVSNEAVCPDAARYRG